MTSREGKFPPPDELAMLIRHWKAVWPNAQITRELVQKLYPYILAKWREGWNLAQIAQTACSCNDGASVAPSDAALKFVPKRRLSLSPTGAVPGQTFGSDEIRDVSSVANLKLKKQVAVLQTQKIGVDLEIIYTRLAAAPASGEARANLEKQRQKLVSKQEEQRQVAAAADARLAELESTGRLSAVGVKPKVKKEPVQKAEPTPQPTRQKRPAKAATPAPATPAPAPSPPPPAASPEAVEDAIAKMYEDD